MMICFLYMRVVYDNMMHRIELSINLDVYSDSEKKCQFNMKH